MLPGWPCTIDLHNRFPGLLAPPVTTFEALWAGRTILPIAHHDTPVPGVADHFVMLAVNAIRSAPLGAGEQHPDVARGWAMLDEAQRARALDLTRDVGATEPLRETFARLGVDVGPADPRFRAAWRAWVAFREAPSDSGRTWSHRLATVPLRERPRRLAAAVWDVSLDNSRTPEQWAAAGPWVRTRARAARLVRATRVGVGLATRRGRRPGSDGA